ncbi:MAG: glutaredoxin domain-containing protein [Kiloniellaceae bacterium]
MPVTIYHNPRCGKSRAALALLRERGIEPRIVDYLETPPDSAELSRLLDQLGSE